MCFQHAGIPHVPFMGLGIWAEYALLGNFARGGVCVSRVKGRFLELEKEGSPADWGPNANKSF